MDGFITGGAQQLKEITLAGEYAWLPGIMTKLDTGTTGGINLTSSEEHNQRPQKLPDTLGIAFLAFFPSNHQSALRVPSRQPA